MYASVKVKFDIIWKVGFFKNVILLYKVYNIQSDKKSVCFIWQCVIEQNQIRGCLTTLWFLNVLWNFSTIKPDDWFDSTNFAGLKMKKHLTGDQTFFETFPVQEMLQCVIKGDCSVWFRAAQNDVFCITAFKKLCWYIQKGRDNTESQTAQLVMVTCGDEISMAH